MKRLVAVKKKVANKVRKPFATCHKLCHNAEHPVHLLYFLAVSMTAHGAYAYVAAVCLVLGVIVMIPLGTAVVIEDEEEDI